MCSLRSTSPTGGSNMKSNVFSMMIFYSFAILFVSAHTLAIYQFTTSNSALDAAYTNIKRLDRNQIMNIRITEEQIVSGAHVLQSVNMIKDTGVEITVDGVVFPLDLEIEETDLSAIKVTGNYFPSYKRDHEGSVIQVNYRSQ